MNTRSQREYSSVTNHSYIAFNRRLTQPLTCRLVDLVMLALVGLSILSGCTPTCEEKPDQPRCVDLEMMGGDEIRDPSPGGEVIIGIGGSEGEDGDGVLIGEDGELIIYPNDQLSPLSIDVLVLAPIDQSLIVEYYAKIIEEVTTQLARYQVSVAHMAIAPMYRRLNFSTPLLYGEPDAESEFDTIEAALAHFSSEDGLMNLLDGGSLDGDNLLQLGKRLGNAVVHHPFTPTAAGQPLYREPERGMLVLWINPFGRRCDLSSCGGEEGLLIDQLLNQNDAGEATWLTMGGQSHLPIKRVVHAFIATEETSDYSAFINRCESRPGLPTRILDHIEPSEVSLYQELHQVLGQEGAPSVRVDFCQALSEQSGNALEAVANRTRVAIHEQ